MLSKNINGTVYCGSGNDTTVFKISSDIYSPIFVRSSHDSSDDIYPDSTFSVGSYYISVSLPNNSYQYWLARNRYTEVNWYITVQFYAIEFEA